MNYYCNNNETPEDTSDDRYYKTFDGTNYSDEITGIMKAIAGSTINNIDTNINNLKATDVLPSDSAIIKLLGEETAKNTSINELSTKVTEKINLSTIGALVDAGIIDVTGLTLSETVKAMTIYEIIETVNSIS